MALESYVASLTVYNLCNDNFPVSGCKYEDVQFPNGYSKPTKEIYEYTFTQNLNAELFKIVRKKRDKLLSESDWLFTEDYHLEDDNYKEWIKYRQCLRDIPSMTQDPQQVKWPSKPEIVKGECSNINENFEIKQLITENTQLRAKMVKLEKRITDIDLSIIQLKRAKNKA
jgi:hypothetical protein